MGDPKDTVGGALSFVGLSITSLPNSLRAMMQAVTPLQMIKHPAASHGVLTANTQPAGSQPAFAPRGGELNPQRLMGASCIQITSQLPVLQR